MAGKVKTGTEKERQYVENGFRSAKHSYEPFKANAVSGKPSTEFKSHLHSSKVTRSQHTAAPFLFLFLPFLPHNPFIGQRL